MYEVCNVCDAILLYI